MPLFNVRMDKNDVTKLGYILSCLANSEYVVFIWPPIDCNVVGSPNGQQEPSENWSKYPLSTKQQDLCIYYCLHANNRWNILSSTWYMLELHSYNKLHMQREKLA